MNSLPRSLFVTPLLALTLLLLSACASVPSAEPPLIARKPKPAPLPAAVLQIDLKPSTATLSRGQQWLQSTEQLLPGETPKQFCCASRSTPTGHYWSPEH